MEKPLSEVLSSFVGKEDELIPILQKVQYESGYLSEEAMHKIAEFTGVPES